MNNNYRPQGGHSTEKRSGAGAPRGKRPENGAARSQSHRVITPADAIASQRRNYEQQKARGVNPSSQSYRPRNCDYQRSEYFGGPGTPSNRTPLVKNVVYEVNTTAILFVVSILIAVVVLGGVIANYMKKVQDNNDGALNEGASGSGTVSVNQKLNLYDLDAAEVDPQYGLPLIRVFDKDGRIIISPLRAKNGQIEETVVYEYDDEGTPVVEKHYGADGRLVFKNVKGGKDEGVAKTLYETEFDTKGSYSGYTETLFDSEGGIIEKIKCSYNGVVEGKYIFEYDEQGRVATEKRYTPYGDLSVITSYKYDSFGNNTEVIQSDSTGKEVLRDVYVYDDGGRITYEEHHTLGIRKSYVEYTYDENGTVSKRTFMLKDENTMTYQEIFN